MERKCLGAFTPPGSWYPPYISINETDAGVEITVRAERKEDGSCGEMVSMTISSEEFQALVREIQSHL